MNKDYGLEEWMNRAFGPCCLVGFLTQADGLGWDDDAPLALGRSWILRWLFIPGWSWVLHGCVAGI